MSPFRASDVVAHERYVRHVRQVHYSAAYIAALGGNNRTDAAFVARDFCKPDPLASMTHRAKLIAEYCVRDAKWPRVYYVEHGLLPILNHQPTHS